MISKILESLRGKSTAKPTESNPMSMSAAALASLPVHKTRPARPPMYFLERVARGLPVSAGTEITDSGKFQSSDAYEQEQLELQRHYDMTAPSDEYAGERDRRRQARLNKALAMIRLAYDDNSIITSIPPAIDPLLGRLPGITRRELDWLHNRIEGIKKQVR